MIRDILFILFQVFIILLVLSVLVHIFFLVPYVPSKKRVIEKMISVARLKPRETAFDLGCGDGRLLIAAEKKAKIKAIGFELAPLVYIFALIRKLIFRSHIQINFKNLFKANLRRANVIFCYLLPNVMPRLAAKIKRECKKGTRIISNTFHIPGLKLARIFKKNPALGLPTIYVYHV